MQETGCGSRGAGDVVRGATAVLAAKRDVGVARRRNLVWIALDGAGAGWAAEGRSASVVTDKEECLSGVVRVRTWLAHELSSCNKHGAARRASYMGF